MTGLVVVVNVVKMTSLVLVVNEAKMTDLVVMVGLGGCGQCGESYASKGGLVAPV